MNVCESPGERAYEHWERANMVQTMIAARKQEIQKTRTEASKELTRDFEHLEASMPPYELPVPIAYCTGVQQFEKEYDKRFGNAREIFVDMEWSKVTGRFTILYRRMMGQTLNRISTIQFAHSSGVIVYQLETSACPTKIKQILTAGHVTKYGVGIRSDMKTAEEVWGFSMANTKRYWRACSPTASSSLEEDEGPQPTTRGYES
ncbi:uncharacterized protein EI90DRAFT_3021925 [Cantharellus anzutake]|uniref:uncharacterized protein n=1 Tax=Cantharellus anzutake TaxID=1750568 RepID=UPI0019038A1A|nr:uncharacterized protein EI90DRAFT_3021925 [Cantharellus anzutake]KAF8315533.1 hypothetical protein EI90DRAFT_3021925 [Cantharellus anzutake]